MKFNVQGMACSHCVGIITKAIHSIDPNARVDVDLDAETVTIEGGIDAGLAMAAIEAEGYGVEPQATAAPKKTCCGCS
ncbi:MAG: heavy-metal-associated domain-containing protein [Lysobacter sp.]|nr:heavy-metal-associated domain-containing protein [Lysobacter sp.]